MMMGYSSNSFSRSRLVAYQSVKDNWSKQTCKPCPKKEHSLGYNPNRNPVTRISQQSSQGVYWFSNQPMMAAVRATNAVNPPVTKPINRLYLEFWASILEFWASILDSNRETMFADAILLMLSVSSTAASGWCPAFWSNWEIREIWPTYQSLNLSYLYFTNYN